MCDIRTLTKLKKVTIYKWVIKRENGDYISPLFEAIIKVGSTNNMKVLCDIYHDESSKWFNGLMKEKKLVSGFAKLDDAKYAEIGKYENCILIKITLSGDIYTGTAGGLAFYNSKCGLSIKTYAGNFIESIKEVKLND